MQRQSFRGIYLVRKNSDTITSPTTTCVATQSSAVSFARHHGCVVPMNRSKDTSRRERKCIVIFTGICVQIVGFNTAWRRAVSVPADLQQQKIMPMGCLIAVQDGIEGQQQNYAGKPGKNVFRLYQLQ